MVIIAGHVLVAEAERDRCVALFQDLVRRCREADGCIDMAISADPVDPARVNNLEVWASAEALDAWRAVADAPDPGVAMDASAMARDDATDGGPLFPSTA
ncbi:antibiotic biosynthesis monooxygenase [Iamia majanohamensis]|uniref:Antibiotic biosynthesis monooxygenase n=1 Tax=Iamia majanohamensis TaxID=467976 RepID=A0AAE9Y5Y3_9ACTN|nr:antibiotic biosynthesis monooxygenase family protein [Iamia majanohamensis]WCO67234.1 antibiotic biosynthesis monooxygenase [Iamia majanohamensis]